MIRGGSPPNAGRYLGTTVLTSGTSFTTGSLTNKIFIRVQAGGGAGGGGATAAVSASAGGGGSAGGYAEKTFTVAPSTAYTYAIGAAGAAGAAGANDGLVGGNSTFAVGATTVTAFGGLGGIGMAATTTVTSVLGGASPAISTNGDVNTGGEPGDPGIAFTGLLANSGAGGSSIFGSGGNGRITAGTGAIGVGNGAGGSGGVVLNGSSAVAGGVGLAGIIVVDEYA